MPFAGLDLHKQVIEAAIAGDDGALVHKSRFPATREALLAFAARWLNRETSVARRRGHHQHVARGRRA